MQPQSIGTVPPLGGCITVWHVRLDFYCGIHAHHMTVVDRPFREATCSARFIAVLREQEGSVPFNTA